MSIFDQYGIQFLYPSQTKFSFFFLVVVEGRGGGGGGGAGGSGEAEWKGVLSVCLSVGLSVILVSPKYLD